MVLPRVSIVVDLGREPPDDRRDYGSDENKEQTDRPRVRRRFGDHNPLAMHVTVLINVYAVFTEWSTAVHYFAATATIAECSCLFEPKSARTVSQAPLTAPVTECVDFALTTSPVRFVTII